MAAPNRPHTEKPNLHPRNRHRDRYDFPELIRACPELAEFVSANAYNDLSVDFRDPDAVKALNKALLKHFYGIEHWDIPPGYLCPPIPGRADYILYAADLLRADHQTDIAEGPAIRILDVGVGANCIYPLIGVSTFGWRFVGSEVDPAAARWAQQLAEVNGLTERISIRKQPSAEQIFRGVIRAGEHFDLTICNPPFYASRDEAAAAAARKWKNLAQERAIGTRNFGGTRHELWCEGGEGRFLKRMIGESSGFRDRCLWFTSLVSDKDNLRPCYRALERTGAADIRTIPMSQGQKVSRILAWSFLDAPARTAWRSRRKDTA